MGLVPKALLALSDDKPITHTLTSLFGDNESRPLDMNGHWMAKGLKMKGCSLKG
jgi:hypothetical protein